MGWVMRHEPAPKENVYEKYRPAPEIKRQPTQVELEKVEAAVVALAKSAETLILKSPLLHHLDLKQLAEVHPQESVRKLLLKPRIDLAQKIIRGFWNNELPLYQDVLRTRFPTINNITLSEFSHEPVSSSESKDWPPPLPLITDKELESRVFTHSSVFKLQSHVFKLESTMRNNERLEFLGDSVLERAVCDMLFKRFPNDTEGQLTEKKIKMVRNLKLDEFAIMYQLEKRFYAQLPDEEVAKLRSRKHKIFADLFEAYIGGVYENKGYAVCEKWLGDLYSPMLETLSTRKTAKQALVQKETQNQAKATLYKKIGTAQRRIEYREMNNTTPFTIDCLIDGIYLGTGSGPTKKEAGNNAALDALSKTALIEEQANIRADLPRTAPTTSGLASP